MCCALIGTSFYFTLPIVSEGFNGQHGGRDHHSGWGQSQSGQPRRGGPGGASRLARLGLGVAGAGAAVPVARCVLLPRLVEKQQIQRVSNLIWRDLNPNCKVFNVTEKLSL